MDWYNIEKNFEELVLKTDYVKHFDEDENRKIRKHSERVSRNFVIWNKLFTKVERIEKLNEEKSIFRLSAILFMIEGPLSFILDYVIYNLIMKEKQKIKTWDKKGWVSRFDELPRISLSCKLGWLKERGFNFNEICPLKLRNAIAHLNFDIIGYDGTVHIEKGERPKNYTLEEIEMTLDNIMKLMIKTSDILQKARHS